MEIINLVGVYNLIKNRSGKTLQAIKFIFQAKVLSEDLKKTTFPQKWLSLSEMSSGNYEFWDLDMVDIISKQGNIALSNLHFKETF